MVSNTTRLAPPKDTANNHGSPRTACPISRAPLRNTSLLTPA